MNTKKSRSSLCHDVSENTRHCSNTLARPEEREMKDVYDNSRGKGRDLNR